MIVEYSKPRIVRKIIFVSIIIVLVLIVFLAFFKISKDDDRTYSWVILFTGMGVMSATLVATCLFYQIDLSLQIEDNKTSFNTIGNIKRSWTQPFLDMVKNSPESFELLNQMYPQSHLNDLNLNNPIITKPPVQIDPIKKELVEFVWCQYFIQSMEDFLLTITYDLSGDYGWTTVFVQWMCSSILQNYWNNNKHNYDVDAQSYINQIYDTALRCIELKKRVGRDLIQEEYFDLIKDITYRPKFN
jgi:hypothetical protein